MTTVASTLLRHAWLSALLFEARSHLQLNIRLVFKKYFPPPLVFIDSTVKLPAKNGIWVLVLCDFLLSLRIIS